MEKGTTVRVTRRAYGMVWRFTAKVVQVQRSRFVVAALQHVPGLGIAPGSQSYCYRSELEVVA